ncbi:MAG: GFA family protein [Rhodovibrionaceae bacterium]
MATIDEDFSAEGACTCRALRYRMTTRPMFVHCCHCRWCQRETGSAFAINALIEGDRAILLQGEPETVNTPSESGKGQKIVRCPNCHVAIWSHYAGSGDAIKFIRAGTLDTPDLLPPDIHIFTASKQSWVILPPDVPAVEAYYSLSQYWPRASLARRQALLGGYPDNPDGL